MNVGSSTASEVNLAAGVAALVGQVGVQEAVALARQRFCALPIDCLSQADLQSSADSGLHQMVVKLKLGGCDAFLSHSWSDDPASKWETLQLWGDEFKKITQDRRTPLLWLDKACIDQSSNIDEQLCCLYGSCDRTRELRFACV
jgi:hypothetical protein